MTISIKKSLFDIESAIDAISIHLGSTHNFFE